jgi:protease-4
MSNVSVQPVSPGFPPGYGAAPPQQRSGCLVALLVLLAVLLGLSVLANFLLLGKAGGALRQGGGERPEPLARRWVAGSGAAKIALLQVSGMIADEVGGGVFGGAKHPVRQLRRELEQAADDDDVKGVILAVDSPGGTITASDEILELLRRFKKKTGKKVVVHMGALCASGGYYISSGADEIVAEPTTITGSIGVILQTFNVAQLLEKLHVENVTLKAGANKDLLNPFRPRSPEQERIIQGMIDHAYERFVQVVSEGRGLTPDEVKQLADGRIYTADEALRLKLIDRIGYREDALEEAKRLTGAADVTLIRYTRPPTILDVLTGGDPEARAPAAAGEVEAAALGTLGRLATPRLCYLWEGAALGW